MTTSCQNREVTRKLEKSRDDTIWGGASVNGNAWITWVQDSHWETGEERNQVEENWSDKELGCGKMEDKRS